MFKQLVAALLHLYKLNVAHRDIKIENILLEEDTLDIWLCDFGFACLFRPGDKLAEWCGSPFTIAPEILNRVPYSPEAADVWALGSVLYTLLCGAFPFQASDTKEVYERTKEGRFHHFPSNVSRTARDLVARCLIPDPTKRITLAFLRKHPFLWDDDDNDDEDSEEEEEEGEATLDECSGEEQEMKEDDASSELCDCSGDEADQDDDAVCVDDKHVPSDDESEEDTNASGDCSGEDEEAECDER